MNTLEHFNYATYHRVSERTTLINFLETSQGISSDAYPQIEI